MPMKCHLPESPCLLDLQTLRVELLPPGERTPEQLRRVPRRAGHLGGAAQRRRPDAAGADDGPGRRRAEPLGQEGPQEVLQPVPPSPPAVHLSVRPHTQPCIRRYRWCCRFIIGVEFCFCGFIFAQCFSRL